MDQRLIELAELIVGRCAQALQQRHVPAKRLGFIEARQRFGKQVAPQLYRSLQLPAGGLQPRGQPQALNSAEHEAGLRQIAGELVDLLADTAEHSSDAMAVPGVSAE